MAISPSSVTQNGVTATVTLSGSTVTVSVSSTSLYWRVRGRNPDTTHYITERKDSSATFTAEDGKEYAFQVCSSSGSWSTGAFFTVTFDYKLTISQGTGTKITVKRNGTTLSNGATLYKNDSLTITITANTGYEIASRSHDDGAYSVSGNISVSATATVKSFELSLNAADGSTITVNRTSSPKANAGTGDLADGATIYYSDVLKISASPEVSYEIKTLTVNESAFTSGNTHTVVGAVVIATSTGRLGLAIINDELYIIVIDEETEWVQCIPQVDNETGWDICS